MCNLQLFTEGHILNFGLKLPEDDVNDAEICSSNIGVYFRVSDSYLLVL